MADQIVREDLSQEDWAGITLIIDGLMAEGPVAGISEIEDREGLFAGYLKQAERFPMTLATVQNLIAIAQYIDGEQVKLPEIKNQCLELLKSSECYVTVSTAMEQGKGFEEALKLSIPYEEKAMAWLKQNPIEHCMAARLLMASEKDCDEILAAEMADCLPLDMMASGSGRMCWDWGRIIRISMRWPQYCSRCGCIRARVRRLSAALCCVR